MRGIEEHSLKMGLNENRSLGVVHLLGHCQHGDHPVRMQPQRWVGDDSIANGGDYTPAGVLQPSGVLPNLAASKVIDAIRNDRSWFFTHDTTLEAAGLRIENVEAKRTLTDSYRGRGSE